MRSVRNAHRLHAGSDIFISLADTGGDLAPAAAPPIAGNSSAATDRRVDVVFAVLTGKEHHDDRAESVKATWCGEVNSCIFFSDTPSESLPTVSISFEGLPVGLSKYNRAQLRYVPVLNYMRELMTSGQDESFRHCQWMVIVDDDTFVFYHNLASCAPPLTLSLSLALTQTSSATSSPPPVRPIASAT